MPNKEQKNKSSDSLTWRAPSHQAHQHSTVWYTVFAIVSLGLLTFAIYSQSIITIITFLVMIVAVFALSRQSPEEITYHITRTDIRVGHTAYPYRIIKTFWIVYKPPEVKTLNFETTAYINSTISVELGNQDPLEIKVLLSKYLIEDLEREESVTDALARKLKI